MCNIRYYAIFTFGIGSCKCDSGYGSYDCSLDLNKPPSATSLLYGTLCDEKYAPCTQMFIRGGFFASKTVRCHIAKYEVIEKLKLFST